MRVSTKWLRDYIVDDCEEAELQEALTAAGLEIENSSDLRNELYDVVIGFVREKNQILGSDGSFSCRVEVARGEVIDIICASKHEIQVGWGVPVARTGKTLPTGIQIKARANSEGMICLDGELGLVARSSGLQVFRDEAVLGERLPEVSEIREMLLDLSVLPNRPDCLGMIGIAREVAAILGSKIKYPATRETPTIGGGLPFVVVKDVNLCHRYMCQFFRNVTVAESPHWLQSRLQTAGHNPINNVVDITNFVMLEWGQPLHAFDSDKLAGNRIEVRKMHLGEQFEVLGGTLIDNTHDPLVIADSEKPIALAGIMGGAATQTSATTRSVLLEAASFDAVSIRMTSKSVGLRTESARRFERGTDPNEMLTGAFNRAAQLLQDPSLSAAQPVAECVNFYPVVRPRRTFVLHPYKVSRILGNPVDQEEIRSCLSRLEMECCDGLTVSVPTWRVDINNEVVLIEDIARLRGYDNIHIHPMKATTTRGGLAKPDRFRETVAEFLISNAFLECRTAPLVSENSATFCNQLQGSTITIQNHLTTEMTTLRRSLVPSLFEVVERNARRGIESFRCFEIDRVFSSVSSQGFREDWVVAGLVGGAVNSASWIASAMEIGVLFVKGLVHNLLNRVRIYDVDFEASKALLGYVQGESIAISANGLTVGIIGRLDTPALQAKRRSRVPLYAFELNLTKLLSSDAPVRRFSGIARTPSITRDISIAIPVELPYSRISQSIASAFTEAACQLVAEPRSGVVPQLSPTLIDATCVDLYADVSLGSRLKSLTIRMSFRDEQHTLTSGEAQQLIGNVIDRLQFEYNATQR